METIFSYIKTGGMPIPKFKFKVGDKVDYPALTFVKGFVVKEKKYHEKSGMYTYHIQHFKQDIIIDMGGVPATALVGHRK